MSLKINLPLYVNTDKLLLLLLKLIGSDVYIKEFNSKSNINYDLPSSPNNSWRYVHNNKNKMIKHHDFSFGFYSFELKNSINQEFIFQYHTETEFQDFKILSCDSTPVNIALGMRIIKFFGGNIKFTDFNDNSYFNENPKLPRVDNKELTSDHIYFKYHNLLKEEKFLTLEELNYGAKHCEYQDSNFTQEFYNFCQSHAIKEHIEKNMIIPLSIANKQKKI